MKVNFSYFSFKPCIVTPHLNRLVETVQSSGSDEGPQRMFFNAELTEISFIINKYSLLPRTLFICLLMSVRLLQTVHTKIKI